MANRLSRLNEPTATIEKSNKAKQKQQAALDAAKRHCKICHNEIAPRFLCGCLPVGGGSNESEQVDCGEANPKFQQANPNKQDNADYHFYNNHKPQPVETARPAEKTLLEILAGMLAINLLKTESDPEKATLRITLTQPIDQLIPAYQEAWKHLTSSVITELNTFLKAEKINHACHTIQHSVNGNIQELCVRLPSPQLYEVFLLTSGIHNLLTQITALSSLSQSTFHHMDHFYPSPFLTKLRPKGPRE